MEIITRYAMLSLVLRSPFFRCLFFLSLIGSITAAPTPSRIDASFVPVPGTNDAVNVVVPQSDGKVIVAGRFTQANNVGRNRIARFNFDGSLDASFDPGTGADEEITAAVLQPDGR